MPDLCVRVVETRPKSLAELLPMLSGENALESVSNFRVAGKEKGSYCRSAPCKDCRATALPGSRCFRKIRQ